MPRVLRIINRFNLGGPTFNAAYLSRYMAPEYETMLIGGEKESHEESSEFIVNELGITPIVVHEMRRSINPFQDLVAYWKIRKIIKQYKPDIVHTHAAKAGTLGRLAAMHCGVPVIVHTFHGHVFHSYFGTIKTTIFKIIERYLAKKSSMIVTISDRQKEEICNEFKIVKPEKCTIIPLGFDLTRFQKDNSQKRELFRSKYNIKSEEVVIAIVGRVVAIKNHSLFIEALHFATQHSTQKIRAFIVGDGDNRPTVEQKAKELGIDFNTEKDTHFDKVLCFTSWIKEVDVVYSGCDIVALTSLNEGTPVSLIEAEATSKSIISTRVGGIENVVIDGVTGILVENNNAHAFGEKLVELIENEDLRSKLSEKGREFVNNHFHYQRLVKDMGQLYGELMAK